ncbi:hypothetical protein FHT40_006276 [Mycolicibacterium sp. BK556]|uniref:DUF732 domain-containing protein n=1 Tax=Mycobacteriaceae TaxID=1762 RepID=UPI000D3D2572|nr:MULTISPECIES: DUF732 domain-containing protein [Mycobacteriaceae]MBB3606585.1 hypothetical protein [Mycolicibacterium sp. BK556]MBB3636169.1 hypothetical protein [Mycolicibacterium sp. BK607]MBB3753829.1 hypothetical protein [Mycolicibacterium sp. BK634]TDO06631.1 uncharacterized protein DUF732 [Mycobacterium sp. BK086]
MWRVIYYPVAVVVISAVAFGAAPTASADASEDWFLYELYRTQQKWFWPFAEPYILGVGHNVCDEWASGTGYDDAVQAVANDQRWTRRNARYFIALATRAFCPDDYTTAIPPQGRIPNLPS